MDHDDKRVVDHYTSLVGKYGKSFRSLDWSSQDNQLERFKKLSSIGVANGDTLLDVGCGLGDYLLWLRRNNLGDVRYTGMDMTPAMIEGCLERFPDGRFFVGNIIDYRRPFKETSFDWIVASGIFAHRKEAPWDYMKETIRRMVGYARKGVAFNSQSTWAGQPQYWSLFHADPEETLSYCESFGWTTDLQHTPDRSDFTVRMWHPQIKRETPVEPPPEPKKSTPRKKGILGFLKKS